jgi:hypothetical protein
MQSNFIGCLTVTVGCTAAKTTTLTAITTTITYSSHFLACVNFVIGLWAVKFCT